jgi:hypothetical protein
LTGPDQPHPSTAAEPGARGGRAGRRIRRILITLILLVGVLAGARIPQGAAAVAWLRSFLEFYSGVCTLLAATASVVSGVAAAQRVVPIRFRILAQAAHRLTARMAVGFLATHILLKIIEAHADVVDAFLPFLSDHDRTLYVGLGTISGDLLLLLFATGVARGRFARASRPWVWRAVHCTAYLMWPMSIAHGLMAGRTPKTWVTMSYAVCLGLVLIAATGRLPRMARDRRMVRTRKARPDDRAAVADLPSGHGTPAAPVSGDLPDEEFWAALRAEASPWIGGRG